MSQSNQRYLKLEASLKSKFEDEMVKLSDENLKLKDCLKKKVILSQICQFKYYFQCI